MATTKVEFWALAAELISGEFADFTEPTEISVLGAFDYDLQASPVEFTATIPMIKYDYKVNQYDGEKVKIGDYMIIGELQLLAFEPSPDNTKVVYNGEEVNLNSVEIDPARASVILHVRPQ